MLCTYFYKYAYCPICDDNDGKGKEKIKIQALQEEVCVKIHFQDIEVN